MTAKGSDMPLPFNLPSGHRVLGSRRWGRLEGLAVAPLGAARGQREFLALQPGLYASLGDVQHQERRRDVYASGDFIKIHFRMSGQSEVGQARAGGSKTIPALSISTLIQSPESFKEEIFHGGEHERSLTLCCGRPFLSQEIAPAARLSAPFSHLLKRTSDAFDLRLRPMDATQIASVNRLLDSDPADPARGLLITATAFDLLHGVLTSNTLAPLTPNQQRIATVREYLETHLADSFSLPDLAKRFGMSQSVLSREFLASSGQTVFQYLGRARLEKAHRLLKENRMTVTDVALSVGFNHSANFSTAFKRKFGVCPSDVAICLQDHIASDGVAPHLPNVF